jgi:hypothetical protein
MSFRDEGHDATAQEIAAMPSVRRIDVAAPAMLGV